MKLYLHNQKRNRDIDEYIQKLHISPSEFDKLNMPQTNILLVGGGFSPIQPEFSKTLFHITNIDFNPSALQTDKLHQITGDFLTQDTDTDSFDEIWALYSLPLYAQQAASIYVFIAKSMLSLAPNGKLRVFPIEFNNDTKLVTRDAEWEISTTDVTQTTIKFLDELKKIGVLIEIIPANINNEQTVIVKVPGSSAEKSVLNDKMREVLRKQAEEFSKLSKIQIMGENVES